MQEATGKQAEKEITQLAVLEAHRQDSDSEVAKERGLNLKFDDLSPKSQSSSQDYLL